MYNTRTIIHTGNGYSDLGDGFIWQENQRKKDLKTQDC